jgi:Glycosyl hydrolases family 15
MAWGRAALVLGVASVVAGVLVSGGPRDESFRLRSDPHWLAQARPLGSEAPRWAGRMYRRSLLVLRAMTNPQTGAVVAGRRDGWEYVWPRDASAVAMALASAGYRDDARRIVRFLLGLDLGAAARFRRDGTPVEGRAAQGDAAEWVEAAARAVGLTSRVAPQPWRDRADYQEGESGNYLGNAIATASEPKGIPAGAPSVRRPAEEEIQREFGAGGVLVREARDPESGADSAAAWAVRPFRAQALYPLARRTLLRIAAESGRYGIVPSENWAGGVDPWTVPTAWTAWSLAALGERHAALRLMAEMRRDATPSGLLPERVDARTGIPTSTTPLAWSHAFAVLAIRQLWPRS